MAPAKSTQIYLVKRWLELEGYRVFFTEWNSSVLVKKSTTKGKKRQLLTPTTFSPDSLPPILPTGTTVRSFRSCAPVTSFSAIATFLQRLRATPCGAWTATGSSKLYSFAVHPDITLLFSRTARNLASTDSRRSAATEVS